MPKRHIDDVDTDYYLVLFDKDGVERREADGSLLSDAAAGAAADGVSDVFIASHGWMGDIPAAISQYDSWIAAMARQAADVAGARAADPTFKPLAIGVHWPSLPWGVERLGAALLGDDAGDDLAAERTMDAEDVVDLYAERIADTPTARAALATIVAAGDDRAAAAALAAGRVPAALEAAYRALFAESGLAADGPAAGPGSDQAPFAPDVAAAEWQTALDTNDPSAAGPSAEPVAPASVSAQPGLLGGFWSGARDLVLGPVRQVSFWAMKHRARHVGETGVHQLLAALQRRAPGARFHLMGHSFGCIVVTAAIAGPVESGQLTDRLPRPIDSLFLAQGAMSLWSFADAIPFPPTDPGYFRPLRGAPAMVRGPIVTTRSSHDRAVGTFFPLGAKAGRDRLLGPDDLPEYGGIGAFGVQGASPVVDMPILRADASYGLAAGTIYNVEASTVICHGGGAAGAHSDIAHPEVAHIFWQAALTAIRGV
jgi:hypothetical protein